MRPIKNSSICALLLLAATITFVNSSAYAARYYFSQDFTDKGRISGFFDGEDISSDGKITAFDSFDDYEVSLNSFHIQYSGNLFLSKFNCKDCGSQLQDLDYDIASNSLKLTNYGYRNLVNSYWLIDYLSGSGKLVANKFDANGLPSDGNTFTAIGPLTVSLTPPPIPLPGSLILLISSLSGLAFVRRRAY